MKVNYEDTYWCNKGKHDALYRHLWKELVPAQGKAATTRGELLRKASRIYHDLYNNDGGNFDTLSDFREAVADFLYDKGHHVPDWLVHDWGKCDGSCLPSLEYCDCPTMPEFTQQIVDEMESIMNLVIEHVASANDQFKTDRRYEMIEEFLTR